MRSSIPKLLGIVVVLFLVEFGMRGCVDWSASRAIESNADRVGNVSVASGDIPVVFHYGILGRLSNGSVTMHDLVASPVNIAALDVSSANLKLSRLGLISGKAKIKGTAPYTVKVVLSPKNLGDYLHTDVTMQHGFLTAVIDTHPMEVQPVLKGRTIVIADERYTYKVPLPGADYLPCKPTGFGVGGGIAVSCQSDTLPKALADALG